MKMATALEDFSSWLSHTLEKLNTDESVFGSYIQSILESDESSEEKLESLHGILSEIIENEEDINKICNEMLEKWQFHKSKEPSSQETSVENVDEKLVKLLESQSLATTKQKKYTEEERKIREAILSQYSQMTDDENEEEDVNQSGDKENNLEKNTNVQSVLHAEKMKREQAKLDSHRKKEKDKEDREKQKQLREEKKEKRKTQKQERRR